MKAIDPTLLAVSLMQQCLNGFRDEHHQRGWRKKWADDINELPAALRGAVLFAWEQATQADVAEREDWDTEPPDQQGRQ